MDTTLLAYHAVYLQSLDRAYPDFKFFAGITNRQAGVTNPYVLAHWLEEVSRAREVYFMHPFVGNLAEIYYAEPRELLFRLQSWPSNMLTIPPMSEATLAGNRAFSMCVSLT